MSATGDGWLWGLGGLFLLPIALKLVTPHLDSDQAVTGLMGVAILRGDFPLFYWRQHHAGVPESYGAAVSFFLFGVSRLALSLVPALSAIGLGLVLYRTGALLFGRAAGLLAILFATIVSPYVSAHYVLARAYYIEHLLAGHVVLLGAALWLSRLPAAGGAGGPPLTEPARSRTLVAMGLAGGVGFYFGFQIVDALVPAGLALLLVDPWLPLRRGCWLGVLAFLAGSAPFWAYNLTHDWATIATGVRFQGAQPAADAARLLFGELLPVVLGVQDYVGTPPYLPWPASLIAPTAAGAAVLLLLIRVGRGVGRLRRDPGLAGEALLLTALTVTLGVVWLGRFIQVPRYLVPVAPILALVLGRACQLTWQRSRAVATVATAAYLAAVGVPLAGDLTALWPASRTAYREARAADEALFAFLEARGLSRAYSYDYWLAPRLTFDSGVRIIVAEPFRDRYPPHARAVDDSPRPAYILQTGAELFESWMRLIGTRGERARVGPYAIFWDFAPPPPAVALSRAGWTVEASAGTGGGSDALIDGRLPTGWASASGSAGSASVSVDLGDARPVSGVTLVTDRPQRNPRVLEVAVDDGPGARTPVATADTGGLTVTWRNGAPRTAPEPSLTVRFAPVRARRLRLTDLGPGGTWAVSELFVLGPTTGAGSDAPAPLVADGRRLEAAGSIGPALARYREAMATAPDEPAGYAEFARLAGAIGLERGRTDQRANRYARLGLIEEARSLYSHLAAGLGGGVIHAELAQRRARLAAAAGDTGEASRLEAEARDALAPRRPVHAAFGGAAELTGYEVTPAQARPGERLHVTLQWRLSTPHLTALTSFVHVRGGPVRVNDDRRLPPPLADLTEGAQHLLERRQVLVPRDAPPGRYEVTVGVWDDTARDRLRRWWRGLVPMPSRTVELATVEVLPAR